MSKTNRTFRWILSVVLVALGLTVTWAWGRVARLAEPTDVEPVAEVEALYAAWQPQNANQPLLFRSLDAGASWQELILPGDAAPALWAGDGHQALAVALDDGTLLLSEDQGADWRAVVDGPQILSLAWDGAGSLWVGSQDGLYRLPGDEPLGTVAPEQVALDTAPEPAAPITALTAFGGRLWAATPTEVFDSDDGGGSWNASAPVEGWITSLAAVDGETVYVGTATLGIYRSIDAGQSWQPARQGLGLAAGQMVHITALRADPQEPAVLYAAVDQAVGSTEVHASAAGTFVTLDGGESWQPLAGPSFPQARHASALVLLPEQPLAVEAVTAGGLESYVPDVAGALATLQSGDAAARVNAVRLLGMARAPEAGPVLLKALADLDPAVSLTAGDALARLDDPGTVSGLLVALEHPDERVRIAAARTLGQMGVEGAVVPLRRMLFQGSGTEASAAGQALGRIASPEAVEALMAALDEPVPTSRWHATMAGLEAAGSVAVDPLRNKLESRDVYVRRNAAEALGWIASPAATPDLVAALGDKDETVRSQAAWALGMIGDPAARQALERLSTRDPSAAVQQSAGRALALLEQEPLQTRRWYAGWAPVLNRLQAVRWLVLGLSLAAAAWLTLGNRLPLPVPLQQRTQGR